MHFREPILLCDLEEMSYQEISLALGIPAGTVMSRLSRARKALRAQLAASPEAIQGKEGEGRTMSCEECRNWLDTYVDGSCAPSEAQRLEAHLRDCAACANSTMERMNAKHGGARQPCATHPQPISTCASRRASNEGAIPGEAFGGCRKRPWQPPRWR